MSGLYIGIGLSLSGMLHAWVWLEAQDLQSWFDRLQGVEFGLAPWTFATLSVGVGILSGVVAAVALKPGKDYEDLLVVGLALAVIPSLAMQAISSSATRMVYEVVIPLIGVGGFVLTRLRTDLGDSGEEVGGRIEPWKLTGTVSKMCFGMIALLVGTIAGTILSQFEGEAILRREVPRQFWMLSYVGFGILTLVLIPTVLWALECMGLPRPAREGG